MKRATWKITAFVSILTLAGLSGCGYTSRSAIRDKYNTIYVAQFINKIDITLDSQAASKYRIYRPMLESVITQAVIDRFLFDGNLKPAAAGNADLVLKGELIEFERAPLKYTSDDEVHEYRINLAVNISVRDTKTDEPLWQAKHYIGDATYYTSGPLAKSEDEAINLAVTDLSRRIVERTVDQW